MSDPVRTRVLFLCTGNSCRDQIAEGWARHLLADRIDAGGAGSEPQVVAVATRLESNPRGDAT